VATRHQDEDRVNNFGTTLGVPEARRFTGLSAHRRLPVANQPSRPKPGIHVTLTKRSTRHRGEAWAGGRL
jgi:hypothetical protein